MAVQRRLQLARFGDRMHDIRRYQYDQFRFIVLELRRAEQRAQYRQVAEAGEFIDGIAGFFRGILPTAKKSSVLQIRLYAQDAKTGDLLWSNRAEVEYYPLYTRDYKAIFDLLVKQSVKELMQDLFDEYPV